MAFGDAEPHARREPSPPEVSATARPGATPRYAVVVEVQDFISPSIIERLDQQAGLLKPKIDDWRAMVDGVLIDAKYDDRIFNVTLADVPEGKTDLVKGRYEIPGGKVGPTIAVKIIDMLGEEVLTTHKT